MFFGIYIKPLEVYLLLFYVEIKIIALMMAAGRHIGEKLMEREF